MCSGLAGAVCDVLGSGDVLDEVYVVCVAVLLVHALAGSSLALELPPLRRAWIIRNKLCDSRQQPSEVTLNSQESFHQLLRFLEGFCDLCFVPWCNRRSVCVCVWGGGGGDQQGGFSQGLKLTWNDRTLHHSAICHMRVYPT